MAPKSKKVTEEPVVAKKAEEKVEEPVAKKQKADEPAKKEPEKKAEPEKAVEKEVDDKKASGSKLTETVAFETQETTLNVVPAMGGKVLMGLSEGGMQYLIAGARANVAVKSGRYFFETKIVESLNPAEGNGQWRGKAPAPRQLVRVGFSTEGSALVLGAEVENGCYFDNAGGFTSKDGKKKGAPFTRGSVVGVLLNLDAKSPNANTISLFKDGVRASEPYPLPEALQGKPLLPHISYRNVTIHVNFGPELLAPLPFVCRGVQDATASDVVVKKQQAPKDGKFEVVYPVGFPDEGTFEWLDGFLAANKNHVELSERKIVQWAQQSGFSASKFNSTDRPNLQFGVPHMDDQSVKKVMQSIASVVPRNYVVMEVRQNLLEDDRKVSLKRFPRALFKRTAIVAMGEPNKAWKKTIKDKLLKDKQAKEKAAWVSRKAQKANKKAAVKRAKEQAEKQRKAKEELQKKMEAAKKAKEAKEKKEGDKTEGEEAKKEEKEEEKKEEEKPAEEEAEVESEEEAEPIVVSLSEEEAKQFFIKPRIPDIAPQDLEKSFGKFSIPEKSEGFDEIKYDFQDEKKSKTYLKSWVLEKKRTTRVDNLKPGEWFRTQDAEWKKKIDEWQKKYKDTKGKVTKKLDEDAAAETDIFAIEDVCDIGNGEPLFSKFESEDWTLMNLRWELYSVVTAFKKDVDDADREAIPEAHVGWYYNRYHKKNFTPKTFGKDSLVELFSMAKDTVSINDKKFFVTSLEDDAGFDIFVKLAEEGRRARQRRLDAGDEGARLKITAPVPGILGKPEPKPAAAKPAADPKAAAAAPAKAGAVTTTKAGVMAPKAGVPAPKAGAVKK